MVTIQEDSFGVFFDQLTKHELAFRWCVDYASVSVHEYLQNVTLYSNSSVEHLSSDKTSNINKHLSDSSYYRSLSSANCFKILDQASTEYELRIKEAIYIQLDKQPLNKQVKHVNLKLIL